jgi:hypothetical protein
MGPGVPLDGDPHSLGDDAAAAPVGLRQQDGEFLAPVAGDQVSTADVRPQDGRQSPYSA